MASSGQSKGNELLVYVDGTAVAYCNSNSLNVTNDIIDSTSKSSSGWSDKTPGVRSWTVEGDGLYVYASSYGAEDLFALITNKTQVSLKFTTALSGDDYYTGSAYLTSLGIDAPNEDNTTFSFSFEGDGALTQVTLT